MKKQPFRFFFQPLKFSGIASAYIYLLAVQSANAQTPPTATDVLRNIEQSTQALSRGRPKAATKKPIPVNDIEQDIQRLIEVRVQSPLLQKELMSYWLTEINKQVSAQKLSEFKAFAWELFQSKGYLAYITTHTRSEPNGSLLTVNVSLPKLNKVSVITLQGDQGKEYVDEVARRFNAIYKAGMAIDIQGIENQLNAVSYDLPVDLQVSMKQINATEVDLEIQLLPLHAQPGKLLGGIIQANNFGLSQFGRNQMLGNIKVAGFTPSSELTLTTQQSLSVSYYRWDYEAPFIDMHSRLHAFGGNVKSSTARTAGLSDEVGIGLTTLVYTDRNGRWLAGSDISRRETKNSSSDVATSDRVDQQARLKLRIESTNKWVENFSNEILYTIGRINVDRIESDKLDDAQGLRVAGEYQKIEITGKLSQTLDSNRIYTGSVHWKAQAASKNLDSYNRMSLGGISGIRAYSSIDGVGDQGLQMSFDIIHQIVPDVYGGLFYDVGVIKNNHSPLNNATDTHSYLLQGAGWQVGGKIHDFNWSLSTAHAFGKTPGPGVWTSANTQPGDFRVNFAVTRPF
jgi:hemolysin activation/secretion protein